jgi:nucleoid DNA-binding protein
MNYTRNDLASDLSRRLKISEPSARSAVNEFVSCLTAALKTGKRVEFRGFASLEVRVRKQKVGRNPQKPDSPPIIIPSKRFVRFKASKELDQALNS